METLRDDQVLQQGQVGGTTTLHLTKRLVLNGADPLHSGNLSLYLCTLTLPFVMSHNSAAALATLWIGSCRTFQGDGAHGGSHAGAGGIMLELKGQNI